jgi:uncharacterized protein (TIGR00304 family)
MGIILAIVAVIIIATCGRDARETKAGGILLIGPIPIVFGTDKQAVKLLIILAIILMLVVSWLTILPYLAR